MVDQVEKVARAIAACDNEEGFDAWEDNPSERGWRCWYEYARAAITAYNPNERLSQEVDELKHDVERQMSIANAECNEVERLREALEKIASCDSHHPQDVVATARAALSHKE